MSPTRYLDFADDSNRTALEEARAHIIRGYRILRDAVGVDNPSDNGFLREATICAHQHLIWIGDRGGVDAQDVEGREIEIKTTRLDERPSIAFPTSRMVSQTVIDRFRSADYFLFGIFDVLEEMIALYRVQRDKMEPLVDWLEERLGTNNPKFPFTVMRSTAEPLYLSAHYEEGNVGGRWTLIKRS